MRVGKLAELRQDPRNANQGTDRGRDMLAESFRKFGAARSAVADRRGVLIAGNKSQLAAAAAGLEDVIFVPTDGRQLVVVQRTDLDLAKDPAAVELALADNRTAEVSLAWNPEILSDLARAGVDLSGFWSADELAALIGGVSRPGKTDPDAVPALRATTSIQVGDLFELGRHVLLCGDSTNASHVAKVSGGGQSTRPGLMVTDPPYGVNYDPTWRNTAGVSRSRRVGAVANDDRVDWTAAWKLFPGDVAYVWHAGLYGRDVQAQLEACRIVVRSQVIWRKPRLVLSRGHYHWQHEPCWYAVRDGRSAKWAGDRKQTTVWPIAGAVHCCSRCGSIEFDAPLDELPSTVWDIDYRDATGETIHSTQKPVECMARPMRNHAFPVVYEPFSGSGSTIIAGEMLGRSVRAVELMPIYVQQAIDRWEAFTGAKARKVASA